MRVYALPRLLIYIALSFASAGSWAQALPVQAAEIRWIDMAALEEGLAGQPPMAVGFDIDDTVLFSSPCFHFGKQKYSPGTNDYLRNDDFWQELNAGCDRYSMPKDIARKLISLHQARGDSLYFITARPETAGEQVTELVQKAFAITGMHPVVFTGSSDKTAAIRKTDLAIYYGDSDSDVRSALNAGARPIRVMRAHNSTNRPMPANGSLGEEVLMDSEY